MAEFNLGERRKRLLCDVSVRHQTTTTSEGGSSEWGKRETDSVIWDSTDKGGRSWPDW